MQRAPRRAGRCDLSVRHRRGSQGGLGSKRGVGVQLRLVRCDLGHAREPRSERAWPIAMAAVAYMYVNLT